MSVESTAVINQQIREYVEKNPKSLFDPTTSYRLLSLVRAHIFGDNPAEQVNAISLLSTLTERAPKFQQINSIYDQLLFDRLFMLLSLNIKPLTFSSILRISSVFLSGRLTFNRMVLLQAVHQHEKIIPIICNKVMEDPLHVIQFISKLLYCAVEMEYLDLIVFMRSLRSCGFFISICDIIENESSSADTKARIAKLSGSIIKMKDFLRKRPLNMESKIYQSMVAELMELYLKNLSESGSIAVLEDYVKAGLTQDPRDFITETYNSVNLLDLLFFLKNPNLTFKKEYCEQLIFANEDTAFPLSVIGVRLSNFLFGDVLNTNLYPNIRDNLYAVDSLFFSSMTNVLKIWKHSKATLEDIPVVMANMYGLMRYANSLLELRENGQLVHSIREVLDSLMLLTYEEIKKLQIKEWKHNEEITWSPAGLDKFNEYLKSEVLEFVKEQRLLKLSKGSWVYSEDPMELSLQGKKPQMYFMILSPNNSAIIYKEFKTKTKVPPNIDKTGRYLNINTIASFESVTTDDSDKRLSDKSNSKLISLKSRSSFKRITLKNKNKKTLLSFYTDTLEASYIWSDGLKMMSSGKINDLSDDTKKQIDTLAEVRKSGQMANLNEEDFKYVSNLVIKEDVDVYNPVLLDSLAKDFYYD